MMIANEMVEPVTLFSKTKEANPVSDIDQVTSNTEIANESNLLLPESPKLPVVDAQVVRAALTVEPVGQAAHELAAVLDEYELAPHG
jgi:hypothetical protein